MDILNFNPSQLSAFNDEQKTSRASNPMIYKTKPDESKSSDGVYRSTIRVIYNPFDLKLPEVLIKSVVYAFKPAVSMANIIMHDKYGREYQYPAHYYFSNYGNGLYYPNDYEGINVW